MHDLYVDDQFTGGKNFEQVVLIKIQQQKYLMKQVLNFVGGI